MMFIPPEQAKANTTPTAKYRVRNDLCFWCDWYVVVKKEAVQKKEAGEDFYTDEHRKGPMNLNPLSMFIFLSLCSSV
jgi:hypothetical protein